MTTVASFVCSAKWHCRLNYHLFTPSDIGIADIRHPSTWTAFEKPKAQSATQFLRKWLGNSSLGHRVHSNAFFEIRANHLSWNGDFFPPIWTILIENEPKMVGMFVILTPGSFDCIFRDLWKSPMMKITNFRTNFDQLGGNWSENGENYRHFDTRSIRLHFSRFEKITHVENNKFWNKFSSIW